MLSEWIAASRAAWIDCCVFFYFCVILLLSIMLDSEIAAVRTDMDVFPAWDTVTIYILQDC